MNNFKEIIKEKVLVKFGAQWCGPCKTVDPILKELSDEGYNIYSIDTDEEPDLTIEYNIRSVPSFILFENSKEIDRKFGTRSKQQFIEFYGDKK